MGAGGMMPLPLIRSAQTEGQQPAGTPPGAGDLLEPSPGQPTQDPQQQAQAKLKVVRDMDKLADALSIQAPEVLGQIRKLKDDIKEIVLALAKNSGLPESPAPRSLV